MLKTAVAHGADAVYLGLESFSARAKADDFTSQNLAFYVAYCHKFGVKVYVTLNTVVKLSEMKEALRCAAIVYEAGADAVLVQDLGLASLLRSRLPDLTLHASTQMGVHNVAGAEFARRCGFSRVVLARETPFTEIAAIARLGVETEVFAHGALCVSFSGNCYYSSLVSGNSGNRGRCLQLCRKRYRAECASRTETGSFLSPADLCLLGRVKELEAMGVASLKIEGRLKRPEYAGIVVDAYRRALQGEMPTRYDTESLTTVFSRGPFCEGYADLTVSDADFVGKDVAGHLGLPIAEVLSATPNSVEIETKRRLSEGDGFKIMRGDREIAGASHPKRLSGNRWRLSKLGGVAQTGDRVYLTTDAERLRAAAETMRKIPLEIVTELKAGNPARIVASDGVHRAEIFGDVPEPARSAPLSADAVEASFARLGDTDYTLARIEVRADEVFLPKAKLNELRRSVIGSLEKSYFCSEKSDKDAIMRDIIEEIQPKKPHSLYVRTDDMRRALPAAALVFAPEDYRRLPSPNCAETYLELPVVAFGADCALLESQIETIRRYDGVVANNVWGVEFARRYGLSVIAGFGLNIANPYFARDDVSFDDVFFSPEAGRIETAVSFGFGEFPLMTFAHCPYLVVTGKGCGACAYDGSLTYEDDRGKIMRIRRMRLARCYFTMNDILELPPEARRGRTYINAVGADDAKIAAYLRGERVSERGNYFESVR